MSKNLLDVDDTIIRKNLLLAETKQEDEDLGKLLKTFEAPIPTITFRPLPGVCIKTKTDKGEKVFINLCHTSELPPPKDITDEEFYLLLESERPNWCIPMSIGHERFESSKDGTQCLTYDIALNTKYFNKIQKEKVYFTFTILATFDAIEDKHEKTLDNKGYVVLKNRKVTGTLHDHRVQKREIRQPELVKAKQLIEEIPEAEMKKIDKKSAELNAPNDTVTVDESNFILLRKPKDGNTQTLMAFFKLPNQSCCKDISVNINKDRVVIEAPDFNYCIDIFLPHLIDQAKAIASIDQNLQVIINHLIIILLNNLTYKFILQVLRLEMPVLCS